jgi:hypothetical protein
LLPVPVFLFARNPLPTTGDWGGPQRGQAYAPTKIAEGEHAINERGSGGSVGRFQEEAYNFHEHWTLWRVENGQYRLEGVRYFESSKDETLSNRFVVELSRDLTMAQK